VPDLLRVWTRGAASGQLVSGPFVVRPHEVLARVRMNWMNFYQEKGWAK
jgi:hypothetical protein